RPGPGRRLAGRPRRAGAAGGRAGALSLFADCPRAVRDRTPTVGPMHKLRSIRAAALGLAVLAGALLTATPASAVTRLAHDTTPSDANIAVGPSHIVEVVNSQIGFWSKASLGAPLSTESIQAFLGTATSRRSAA